jgi:inner membrane protein
MTITFSPWLIWFLAGIAIILAELAIPGFVIIFFGLGCLGAAFQTLTPGSLPSS